MNHAALYQRVNNVQRQDAKEILQEYRKVLQWRSDGRDKLIDIGCGSGNVLIDLVHPIMPENFSELLGTDISAPMIDYAAKYYDNFEHTNFKVLDIGAEKMANELCEQFDHVTSFYCLHWVQNQKQALQNIYKLLRRDGGDCLLLFLAKNPLFDVYKELYKLPKWTKYMEDVERYLPPFYYSQDPAKEYGKLLSEVGFVDYSVEVRDKIFYYDGVQDLRDNIEAVCPFLERISKEQHSEYLDDFVNIVISMKLREHDKNTAKERFMSAYKLVVVYARKCDVFVNSVIDIGDRTIRGLN